MSSYHNTRQQLLYLEIAISNLWQYWSWMIIAKLHP